MNVFGKLLGALKGMHRNRGISQGEADSSDSATDLQGCKREAEMGAACKREAEMGEVCKSAAESVLSMREGRALIDPYSSVPKKSRFQKKLEMAMMPRCRKHKVRSVGKVRFVRPSSHIEAALDYYAADPRQFGVDCTTRFLPAIYNYSRPSAGEALAMAARTLAVAAVMDVGEAACRLVTARRRAAEREAACGGT